jgi:cephalosporin-C deacetylase-like acetyl esterase
MSLPLRFCLAVLFLAPAAVWGQDKTPPPPKPGDIMIEKYQAQETAKFGRRFLDGAKTREEWEQRRPRLMQEYLYMLGLAPLPEKTPLHVTVTGTLERDDFVVEKLHFQSRPGLYVTGNLYRPKKVEGKLPAVLYVCGHSARGRNGNKTAFQDHGMWFATNGYVCLVIDTLQLGEIPGIHHGTYNLGRWWWQARGYTPAGVECWNGIRALDYLVSRPDVDADRLAVTGISGGGAATFWIAAADERVKVAVPVSGMSDLESYVTNKVINSHCDCMFLYNTYAWEWTTIAALVAPRPLLFANSDKDSIFPMDGNRRIIARLRQLYQMYGKPDLVDDHVSPGGHDYRPDLRIAVFKWINKHLKHDTGPVKDADFKWFPNEQLRVFPEDKDVPEDAINGKVDETFVPQAVVKLPTAGAFTAWKDNLFKELRSRAFRTFPEQVKKAEPGAINGGYVLATRLTTEPGIRISRFDTPLVLPPGLLIVLNADEPTHAIPDWSKPFVGNGLASSLACRGVGPSKWTRKSPPNYVERSHALLGRTVDSGRVWDIASAVRAQQEPAALELKVAGRGQAGILAAYAALFEPSISEVIVVDPPASHRDGPIFLNVQRVLDIPEVLGLLAPRPLTLVNAKDKAFERTAQIYKLAGAADKLKRIDK